MMKTTLVFVPDTFQLHQNGCLEGSYREYDECDAFYVTNGAPVKASSHVVGYTSDGAPTTKLKICNGLHVDSSTARVSLGQVGDAKNLVKIIYDYEALSKCGTPPTETQHGVHFKFLCDNLRKRRRHEQNGRRSVLAVLLYFLAGFLEFFLKMLDKSKLVWGYSATLSHFHDSLTGWKWFLNELIKDKRLSPQTGNFVLSKLLDISLGVVLLRFFIANEDACVSFIENTRETIIRNFRDLLMYLMGSPIGLKLNYAFNNILGTFFFYHISLWRIFLITTQPFIKEYFHFLVLPGAFGFSYQLAMLSDLILAATFHVYCIYVYAARLIFFQLKGLLSLWRLFIGRKYNPLRDKVDSHQYSQHQLFIGTLGFTVLLFLLPTTTMYYTVFVIFRLTIMIMEELLTRIRHWLHGLPLYVLILWSLKSPHMAGLVCLERQSSDEDILTFKARLQMLPLSLCVRKYAPDIPKPGTNLSWNKIFTGVLL